MTHIDVQDLHKRFGAVHAVDGVSFQAGAGEICGVLGPNGAGKTTTLRLLATTLKPDAGTATIYGHDILREPVATRRAVGMLTASIGLYPRLTARENVAYFARLYGMSDAQTNRRITALFALLDMESYADRRTDTFSTGMKQKVAIARAVVHDPPIMIFDEPTSGLDVLGARTVVEFIQACRAEGKCVLLSTHQMAQAAKLCDRVVIIHHGAVLQIGTVPELLARTRAADLEDAFLALIGERPLGQRHVEKETVHA
jgi:sodium transport system ATP-binding protein